jgi:hypothetical protein
VVDRLVDLELVVARSGLEEEVVGQVADQVTGGVDVVAVPRLPHRVLHHGGCAAGEELLAVAAVREPFQRAAFAGFAVAGAGQHRVDRGRDELDVAELLGGDRGDQVIERPGALAVAKVERLIGVVHKGRHLAELSAEQLLNYRGSIGVRI